MPRTLFRLQHIHGTPVTDGTHQTSTWPLLIEKHSSNHGSKACIPAEMKSGLHVCSQYVTAGFMLLTSANHLPARSLSRGPYRWKSLGPIIPTVRVTAYGWEVKTTLPTVLI